MFFENCPDDLSTRHIDDRNPILPPDVVEQFCRREATSSEGYLATRSGLSSRVEQLVYQIE